MLVFVSLAAESDVPNRWLSAVTVARIFRKVTYRHNECLFMHYVDIVLCMYL